MNTKSSGVINTAEVEEKARIKKGGILADLSIFFIIWSPTFSECVDGNPYPGSWYNLADSFKKSQIPAARFSFID